jgi:hypothetical protein
MYMDSGLTLEECKELCDSNSVNWNNCGVFGSATAICFAIEYYTYYPDPSYGYNPGFCALNCGDADDIDEFTCLEDDWDGTGSCKNLDVYLKSDDI